MAVRCEACGSENHAEARFCAACGARLARHCPACGVRAADDARFCSACGTALDAAAEERTADDLAAEPTPTFEARALPAAERRLVSVLFVDLVGFTAIAESLDPEEARDLLDRYYELARTTVDHHDGTLEKFIGDAVMAVWGAPSGHEDDAQRAVRAGLDLIAAVGRLGDEMGNALVARGAVATGEVAVSLTAAGQGLVAGDLVNTASRMQSVAPGGTLLADSTTRQAVGRSMDFQAEGERDLKGKSSAVPVWRAIGPMEQARRTAHAGSFVGRDSELRSLSELVESSAVDPRSRLVSVTGIAGIGKSRLAWEVQQVVAERLPSLAWYAGRATGYGERTPFEPLAQIFRQMLGLGDGPGRPGARRAIVEAVAAATDDTRQQEWLVPRLEALLVPGSAVGGTRDELFAAWRRMLEETARRTPLVLLVEDAHWAHDELLDFLEYLVDWARRQPIVVVSLARPELLDTRPAWGAGLRSFTALHLDRLPEAAIDALISGLGAGLSADAIVPIRERADGVPLYAVEMVRMLDDSGRLGRGPVALAPSDVPATLHALIAARVDGLPVVERSLLLSAAVLGQRFSAGALGAVAGLSARELNQALRTLVRREFLAPQDGAAAGAPAEYAFVQSLVRDVCYRTLARRERRAQHLAAAAHLESQPEASHESVAEHLLAALAGSGVDSAAPAVRDRARAALRRAGDRAAAMQAHGHALTHYARALELDPEPTEGAELLEAAATEARSAARFDVAEEFLRRAIALRASVGARAAEMRDRAQLAGLLLLAQRNTSALAELESAWSGIETLEPDRATAELAAQLGRAHLLQGRYSAAIEWAERATEIGLPVTAVEAATDALITRGSARLSLGDEGGLADLRDAIDRAAAAGHLATELRARNNLAWLLMGDDPHATLESARRGLELARSVGARDMALGMLSIAASAAIDTGEWAWAVAALTEASADEVPEAYEMEMAISTTILSALQGEPDAGRAIVALEPIDQRTDPQLLAGLDYARAWVAFARGEYESAARLAHAAALDGLGIERFNALALATRSHVWRRDGPAAAASLGQMEEPPIRGRAAEATFRTLRAGLAALTGEAELSRALYEDAASSWRDLNLPFPLALCLLDRLRLVPDDVPQRGRVEAEVNAVANALSAEPLIRILASVA